MKIKSNQRRIHAFWLLKFAAVLVCAVLFVSSASAQNYAVIRSFSPQVLNGSTGFYTNSEGMYPSADLLISGQTLYGVTTQGGSFGGGTVFKVNFDGSSFAVLHNFPVTVTNAAQNYTNSDGANPSGKLLLLGNTLYGTAEQGGINAGGTIFSVQTNGNNFIVLTNFVSNGPNGAFPYAGLVSPDSNTIFGTTPAGGSTGAGVLFKIGTNGSGYSIVRNFSYGATTNGGGAYGQLLASGTNLYGTTYAGASNVGCIYKINTNGTGFTVLKSFSPLTSNTNTDGAEPFGRLTLSGNVLYGTTFAGGTSSNGVIFRVNTDGTGFTNLYSFSAMNSFDNSDGAQPKSAVTLAGNTLYGTTPAGGAFGAGTIFYINTDGTGFATLRTFGVAGNDGRTPGSGFTLSGATFFGTTQYGGANGSGTIYRFQWDNTPPATIAKSGGKIILSWPTDDFAHSTNDFIFTLQSAASPGSEVWTNVSPAPVIINGWNTVTNSPGSAAQFYRISPF